MKSFECFYEFSVCHYHSRLKKRGFLFDQTWIAFIQECFVPNLLEIGPVVLEKNLPSWYYLPLDNSLVLLLYKLESPWRRGALRQVWLKLAQWISLFYRGVALRWDKLEFPLSNKYLFQLVEICSVVLENTTTMKNNNREISIRKTNLTLL